MLNYKLGNFNRWRDIQKKLERHITTLNGQDPTGCMTRWKKSVTGYLKCNLDVAIFEHEQAIGVRFIIKDQNGW
jgi:hypothetical protein